MPRHRINPKLLFLLHERGWTVEKLAAQVRTSRTHLQRVLANVPGRGKRTRWRIAPWLTLAELDLLGWPEPGKIARSCST